MHSKRKGNIGELKVAAYLAQKGYSVFREMGDISKIDLIAEVGTSLLKVQVKFASKVGDRYAFSTKKSGPGYRFVYKKEDVDVFAVYCAEDDAIVWLWAHDLVRENGCSSITLRSRSSAARNNQRAGLRFLEDYLDFEEVILSRISNR